MPGPYFRPFESLFLYEISIRSEETKPKGIQKCIRPGSRKLGIRWKGKKIYRLACILIDYLQKETQETFNIG